jgi:hypothetical protein
MNYLIKLTTTGIVVLSMITGCTNNPKVITASTDQPTAEDNTGVFAEEPINLLPEQSQQSMAEGIHTVTVKEVLPTTKYVYLRVTEGEQEFWIATIKTEVKVGGTYFYQGGLLKTNFESKEHKRVFDKMYLVSSIVPSDHSSHVTPEKSQQPSTTETRKDIDVKGSVKIAELVANPKKYEGKTIQIRGQCVKLNPNIMGRNWVHLQDGSKDDYDLVVTCEVQIPVGHTVTLTGKVVLNKDFGSGYKYDILLEEGQLVR